MKKTIETRLPDMPARRRLLLALPSGALLASPLALLGCGGGGGNDATPVDEGPLITLPEMTVTPMRVDVTLPAGSGVTLANTRLGTMQSFTSVAADGTAAVLALDAAPQLAALFADDGTALMLGYLGDGATRVDARSTAEALVYMACRVENEPAALQIALREVLRTSTVVDPVAAVVAASVGRDGIGADNTALMDALTTAVETIVAQPAAAAAQGRAHALGLELPGGGPQSGIEAIEGVAFNTLQLRNGFRRRAWAWIDRVGHVGADGTLTTLPAPVPLGGASDPGFELSPTTALSLDNVVIAAGDLAVKLLERIGVVGDYAYGALPWTPVDSDPVSLPIEPVDAKRTDYRVRVIGPGIGEGPFEGDEGAKFDELVTRTIWEDVVLPILGTILLPLFGEAVKANFAQNAKALAAAALTIDLTKVSVQDQYVPATRRAIRAGDFTTAVTEFYREFIGSGTGGALLEAGLSSILRAAGEGRFELRDDKGNLIGVNLLTAADQRSLAAKNFVTLLGKLMAVKEVIEKSALAADLLAIAKDIASSQAKTVLDVSVTGLKAQIAPAEARMIAPGSGIQNFTVTLASNNGADSTDPTAYTYEWSCTPGFGEINDGGNNTGTSFTSTSNVVGFAPDGRAKSGDEVTITCRIRRINAGTGGAGQSIVGTERAVLRFTKEYTVVLSPGGELSIPTDTTFPLLAKLAEKPPQGATVTWAWSVSGPATLRQDERYAELYAAQTDTSNRDAVTGTAEGTATVTVRATVALPASGTAPARTVRTDPVSLKLKVESDVETISFFPSGGAFACTDPRACGVSSYGAYIVPVMERAISYTAVFRGFGYGPCNRSVTWNAPVGDGGGCSFPISYHPHNSSGPTNLWAVWLGFGDTWNPDGDCEVTVVLRKP